MTPDDIRRGRLMAMPALPPGPDDWARLGIAAKRGRRPALESG